MKRLAFPQLFILLIGCIMCSCSSARVTESDTGISRSAKHLDKLRGMASGKRDSESISYSDYIISKAGKQETDSSGTYYPGTVKVISWSDKHHALRLVRCDDGSEFWQGPTPPSGFYGSKQSVTYLH